MTHEPDQLYQAVQATRPLLRHITAAVERGSLRAGVTVGQRAILEGLSLTPGATAPQLGAALQMKRQYVSRILQEVQRAGLIERRANPEHARSHRYWLTPKGEAIITAIRADEMEKLALFSEAFSPAELAAYHKVQLALNGFFANLAKEV
ncbi:MarR family winged helix-turn-helix transcriptional regulator [Ruegeria aquimaris]|uniref:MarR family winged helix-turn-helix transcriptional regulator n=1 Tax=Ruegeria aquimaris TaxID=2984333 RepID=A0ABT3ALV9_9RHOB|nr:MarR family winged helix-turn-helix transcriptional regulator [Ruegeria sp. XHP0148]MCV2889679.1 MarR family winged helix-turn-helix transcriptional regulator [Ruegeria sp. XHP0148]